MAGTHTDLAHLTPKERLGERVATLAVRIDATTYQLLVLIRAFDEQEGWANGFASCAHRLNWRIGLAPSAARERARVARALAELPLISEAMEHGQLSYSKVRALTRVATPDTEKSLLDLGRAGTAAHVERVVRAWRRIDRTVEAREDALRDATATVSAHIDENGMFVIRGRLAPEAGEVLMKALGAAGERLFDRDSDDRPPIGKQRADALALVAESALAGGLVPAQAADRQVVVHINEDELRAPEPTREAGREPRVSAETCAGCASAETPPIGPPPHGAWLGDSHIRVSAETARRLASDAATVRMVHRNGEILSVGRKTRTVPPPIRRALEFRDQGCRFPGCTSKHCDAHHIEHWADGGETKLSNLVLLCRRHHRLLHEGGCGVRMDARAVPERRALSATHQSSACVSIRARTQPPSQAASSSSGSGSKKLSGTSILPLRTSGRRRAAGLKGTSRATGSPSRATTTSSPASISASSRERWVLA